MSKFQSHMPSPQNREEMLFALALEKPANLRPAFLDFKERDGVTRLIYRAKFERETLRLAIVLNAAKGISALKLSTE